MCDASGLALRFPRIWIRRFDATRTLVPSIRSSTRASLPGTRQTHRTLSAEKRLTSAPDLLRRRRRTRRSSCLCGVVAWLRESAREPSSSLTSSILRCFGRGAPAFVVLVQFCPGRDLPPGPEVSRNPPPRRDGAVRGTGATLGLTTNLFRSRNAFSRSSNAFSRSANAFSLSSKACSRTSNSVFR